MFLFISVFKNTWDQTPEMNPMNRLHNAVNKSEIEAECFTFEIGGRKRLFNLSEEDHKI